MNNYSCLFLSIFFFINKYILYYTMILKDFIDLYILPNSLIRLHYPDSGGYIEIVDSPRMEWELKKSQYRYNNVIGVADMGGYPEAINIVIEKMPVTEERKIKLEEIESRG